MTINETLQNILTALHDLARIKLIEGDPREQIKEYMAAQGRVLANLPLRAPEEEPEGIPEDQGAPSGIEQDLGGRIEENRLGIQRLALMIPRKEPEMELLPEVPGTDVEFGKPATAFTSGATITLDPCDENKVDNGKSNVVVHVAPDGSTQTVAYATTDMLRFLRYKKPDSDGVAGVLLGGRNLPAADADWEVLQRKADDTIGFDYVRFVA